MTVKDKNPNWYQKNQCVPKPVYEKDFDLLDVIRRKDENIADTIHRVLKKYKQQYEQLIEDFIKNKGLSQEVAEYQAKKCMEEV